MCSSARRSTTRFAPSSPAQRSASASIALHLTTAEVSWSIDKYRCLLPGSAGSPSASRAPNAALRTVCKGCSRSSWIRGIAKAPVSSRSWNAWTAALRTASDESARHPARSPARSDVILPKPPNSSTARRRTSSSVSSSSAARQSTDKFAHLAWELPARDSKNTSTSDATLRTSEFGSSSTGDTCARIRSSSRAMFSEPPSASDFVNCRSRWVWFPRMVNRDFFAAARTSPLWLRKSSQAATQKESNRPDVSSSRTSESLSCSRPTPAASTNSTRASAVCSLKVPARNPAASSKAV
mmetsp:Transcript_16485/g.44658  ORF Transcript_16485/g.44658 Transcript_16485/m.44658 type:complete len:296 (-) Transcript_16485:283-1170(-)